MILCTSCDGFGKHFSRPIIKDKEIIIVERKCDLCNGNGGITDKRLEWVLQGEKLKEYRLGMNVSLRKAARILNMDASNLSKMERGIIKPKNVWNEILN